MSAEHTPAEFSAEARTKYSLPDTRLGISYCAPIRYKLAAALPAEKVVSLRPNEVTVKEVKDAAEFAMINVYGALSSVVTTTTLAPVCSWRMMSFDPEYVTVTTGFNTLYAYEIALTHCKHRTVNAGTLAEPSALPDKPELNSAEVSHSKLKCVVKDPPSK